MRYRIPVQSEIQTRLAFCSHYKNLSQLTENPNYEYIQPPVSGGQSTANCSDNKLKL